ncbi:hypothetical protein Tsubulata_029852 [Turnera subulata]|uniref:AAA+ ATPase domain-containing protein n=2 Tax=Turnera subulata TaxID=218843 RepID=A0A9Q0FAK8_9ROSI|nr:hypothetical protein Tsubulata_029852 [Turnera subulata]
MSSKKKTQMARTKAIVSAAASATATIMLIHTIARDYLPRELRRFIFSKLKAFLNTVFLSELTLVIEEHTKLDHNHLFKAAKLYLEPIVPQDAERLRVSMTKKETNVALALEKNQEIIDTFNGVTLKWKLFSKPNSGKLVADHNSNISKYKGKFYELRFHKKHRNMVLDSYLKHVVEKAQKMKEKKKVIKLFMLKQDMIPGRRREAWQPMNLDHPATFDTLAMDMDLKRNIMGDLERFVRRKDYYKKVGKAWKRGYLLYGPPGTGKSSLIAAMANYLKFDIYDLELTEIRTNSELRRLLVSTGNKSILVVEDIDCSIELQDRIAKAKAMNPTPKSHQYQDNQVTLSGFLNFVDGLWSSCGDERIIVFTTNHKEKIDTALLRAGRMDMHIHLSYCTPCGFKMLASNYLGIEEHPLLSEVEELLQETNITPAEVGEQLMKSEDPKTSLGGLIEFLECRKREIQESAAKQESNKIEETTRNDEEECAMKLAKKE